MAASGHRGADSVELKGGTSKRTQRNASRGGCELGDLHRRRQNARAARIGTELAEVEVVHNLFGRCSVEMAFGRGIDLVSLKDKTNCLHRDQTLVEFPSTLRGRSVPYSEGQAQHAIH